MRVATIDQVVGENLTRLRKAESLTIEQAAEVLSDVTAHSWSVPKLWRWETGKYHFKLEDLFLMSQFYGVSVLGFLKPTAGSDITDIDTGTRIVPTEIYVMDYYVDPRGSFPVRAGSLAERAADGSSFIPYALADIDDRLAEKAGPGDLHSAIGSVRRVLMAINAAAIKVLKDPTEENAANYKKISDAFNAWLAEHPELAKHPELAEHPEKET